MGWTMLGSEVSSKLSGSISVLEKDGELFTSRGIIFQLDLNSTQMKQKEIVFLTIN